MTSYPALAKDSHWANATSVGPKYGHSIQSTPYTFGHWKRPPVPEENNDSKWWQREGKPTTNQSRNKDLEQFWNTVRGEPEKVITEVTGVTIAKEVKRLGGGSSIKLGAEYDSHKIPSLYKDEFCKGRFVSDTRGSLRPASAITFHENQVSARRNKYMSRGSSVSLVHEW